MRVLMLGAGGIGGYFGARVHRAGGDVTFLVRPGRAEHLAKHGLSVHSPLGDLQITPKTVTMLDAASSPFDVIVLSCKAYDLPSAIAAVAPAIGPDSLLLPLLNGFAHLPLLDARFGRHRVLGGLAHLAVTLAPTGEIQHLNRIHRLSIGARTLPAAPQLSRLAEIFTGAGVDFSLSDNIEAEMWGKFIFLTTLAAATCTMRSSIGDILRTHTGEKFIVGLFEECLAVAAADAESPPSPEQLATYRTQLTEHGSASTASMLRDILRGGPTEAEHIVGDMVVRAGRLGIGAPLLGLAYSHLQAYELSRLNSR